MCSFCYAQKETNNWVFGKKVTLNFPTLPKAPPITSFTSDLIAIAGSSSISNKKGELILYTDGVTVWNKKNKTIPTNGLLFGDNEMAQPTIIIPKPNDDSIFYIITVKSFLDVGCPDIPIPVIKPGLYYTKIDISKNDGTVLVKNQNLLPFEVGKISAVHHKDGESIWFTTSGREKETDKFLSFYSFKIDKSGIIKTPVVSKNLRHEGTFNGILKFSPDGKKLASSNLEKELVFFDFDSETGIVSNKQNLIKSLVFFDQPSVYGIEFSNDSKLLYTTSFNKNTNTETLFQYELDNLHPTERIKKIHVKNLNGYTSLQLSHNSKIYKTQTRPNNKTGDYLDVINTPNKIGLDADFTTNVISIKDKSGTGLPNFIQSYFRTRILNEQSCVNQLINFEVDTYSKITAALWDFGDGNSSNKILPEYSYSSPGNYNVKVTITINNRQITTFKDIVIHSNPSLRKNQKLIQCDVNNDGVDYFNLYNINNKISLPNSDLTYHFYETKLDAAKDTNRITNPESYQNKANPQLIFTRATNKNNCYSIENFSIESSYINVPTLKPMIVCEDSDGTINNNIGLFDIKAKRLEIRKLLNLPSTSSLDFFPTLKDAQTITNRLDDSISTTSTKIWLRVDNSIGCGGINFIDLIVNSTPQINLLNEYTLCINPKKHTPIILSANSTNDKFEWRNAKNDIISTNRLFTLDRTGKFSLTVYKTENSIECSKSKTFTVVNPKSPIIKNLEVNTENSLNNFINIEIDGTSTYEYSIDGQNYFGNTTNYTFNNVLPGIKTISIRDINNCEPSIQKEVSIIGFPKFLTPNNDGKNDVWLIYGANNNFFKTIDITIFNRFGKILHKINNNNAELGWEGTYNGEKLPSDGYWYKAKLIDYNNKSIEKTGNISLIRK
ncbi:T9SS type B sorting domain-containing protein [Tenacibaculum sp. nBUS_03]|uniref:T9SS type B sorting domain-containing protein n=1 Tax=Tenacibaculum sp. nBUS_03 TaxID=3395320 RepID=UPI003EBE20A9